MSAAYLLFFPKKRYFFKGFVFLSLSKSWRAMGIGALLFLTGCWGSPYHSYQGDSGYSDTPVGKGIYEIAYIGRPGAPETQTRHFAVIRAADLAKKNKARYFEILQSKFNVKESIRALPSTTYVYGGLYGPYCYGGPTFLQTYPGYLTSVYQPVVRLTIELRRQPSEKTLDANQILKNAVQEGLVKPGSHQ